MRATFLAICMLAALPASAQKAHTHGTGKLDVAVEGAKLTLAVEIPLEDLVGFERAPRNDGERAAVEAMIAYFRSGKGFLPSAAAGCSLRDAKVEATAPDKGHAELNATLVYVCVAVGELTQLDAAVLGENKRLKRLDARMVTSKGQKASRLTPQKRTLAVAP